jgi:hypothetical protein
VAANGEGEDLADEPPVVEAGRLGDEDQVGPAGRQAGERVALDEEDAPLGVHAEVEPGHVPAAQGGEALAGGPLQPVQLPGAEPGRHLVADLLAPVLLHLEGVDGGGIRGIQEDDLHGRQHAGTALAQQAHGELAPGDVGLHQGWLAVLGDELAGHLAQLLLALHHRLAGDPLGGPLGHRLDQEREAGQLARQPLLAGVHEQVVGGQDAMGADHPLGQRLVERDRERRRIRAGVGDVEELQQRGDLRLAVAPLEPLGDVEDHVDRRRGQLDGQVAGGLQVDDLVAVGGDGLADGLQRLGRVVLGFLVLLAGQVGGHPLHVEGEAHLEPLGAAGPAAPAARVGQPPALHGALDDRAQHRVGVQALQRRRRVDAGPGLQRGERVDLQEVGRAVLGEPEVDAPQVARPQDPVDGLAERVEALALPLLEAGRGAHLDVLVEGGLELVVVDGEAARLAGAGVDEVLDRLQHPAPLRRRRLQEGDGDVAADDELLDEEAGRPAAQGVAHHLVEPERVLHHRVLGDALGGALEVGLHHDGEAQGVDLELGRFLQVLPAGRGDAVLRQHQLGELLVQGERQGVGVRAGVGHPQLVEERREEGLAEAAAPPLGGVEDQVGREGLQARHRARGRPGHLHPLDPVAEALEGAGQRVHRDLGVELGLLLGVGEAQVVGQGDAHGQLVEAGALVGTLVSTTWVSASWSPSRRPSGSSQTRQAS